MASFISIFARPAQGLRVDTPPPATITGFLPCIEYCADKVLHMLPHGIWNGSCIANWKDGQLMKNRFHLENVKYLKIMLALGVHVSETTV
jgi:hypothetical protein